MNLRIISTGSIGNCYILENDSECLVIDLGVNINEIKKALQFNLSKVAGAIQSHYHGDHSKGTIGALNYGIDVYMSQSDKEYLNINHHRAKIIEPKKQFNVGGFIIMPFSVKHDVPCLGFIINHKETGNVLFLTDTFYCPYKFKNLNNIIIEANYCKTIVDARMRDGDTHKVLRDRVLESHMSIQTCKDLLQANDLSKVNNIILIHLSDGNSDAKRFKTEVQECTGKTVYVSEPGLIVSLDKNPF